MDTSNIKVVAVVGQTASGKSRLAIEIAKRFDGEVIAADSRTIYRGMDVGTAKPTSEEMEGIAHYGLDLVSPGEYFTAADFKGYAQGVIDAISSRGKLPVLVGGTGLYIDGVLYDYSFGQKSSSSERSALNNKYIDELTTLAKSLGIEIPSSSVKNKRHVIRLIERDGHTENNTELYK